MDQATKDAQNAALYGQIFGDTRALEDAVKADPRFQAAARTKQATQFQIVAPGDRDPRPWTVHVKPDGHIDASRGSVVKPLLAAAAVFATAGLASGAIPGLVASTTAPAATIVPAAAPTVAKAGFSIGKVLTAAAPSLINAGASLVGAHMQVSASDRAAAITADATNRATDASAAANAAALAFERRQAVHSDAVSESTRRANYDQWVAAQHRLGTVGHLLGYGDREIPAYVPIPPGNYDTPAAPAARTAVSSSAGTFTPGGSPLPRDIPGGTRLGGVNPMTGSVGDLAGRGTVAPGGLVLMQGPDGSMNKVSAADVAYYTSHGARVVGGA